MSRNKDSYLFALSMLISLLFNSCGTTANTTNPASNLQVVETSTSTTTVAEPIHLNNCNNTASVEQESERSQSISIEGEATIGIGYLVVEASVSAKYVKTNSVSKTHRVTAAPGTNMEFVLLWTEQVREGTVTVEGKTGQATYRVNVPIAVEQASAKALGCDISAQTATHPSVIQPSPTNTAVPPILQPATQQPYVSDPLLVSREYTGAEKRVVYSKLLNSNEVIAGSGWGFEATTGGCVAFIIIGPGQFQFTVIDGVIETYADVSSSDQSELLLKRHTDILRNDYNCSPEGTKVVRLP